MKREDVHDIGVESADIKVSGDTNQAAEGGRGDNTWSRRDAEITEKGLLEERPRPGMARRQWHVTGKSWACEGQ